MDYRSRTHISSNESNLEEIEFERAATISDYVICFFKSFSFKHIDSVKQTWVKKDDLWVNKTTGDTARNKDMARISEFCMELKYFQILQNK